METTLLGRRGKRIWREPITPRLYPICPGMARQTLSGVSCIMPVKVSLASVSPFVVAPSVGWKDTAAKSSMSRALLVSGVCARQGGLLGKGA